MGPVVVTVSTAGETVPHPFCWPDPAARHEPNYGAPRPAPGCRRNQGPDYIHGCQEILRTPFGLAGEVGRWSLVRL